MEAVFAKSHFLCNWNTIRVYQLIEARKGLQEEDDSDVYKQ